ncbi:MAG: hypothetical protein AAF585_23520, partial [Verrucomicrobiota bacterium]
MEYTDNSPERRNLLVTSIAFIAYCYAGGAISENLVSLSVVNVKFANTALLGWGAYLVLIWFGYRYWVKNGGKYSDAAKKEVARQFWKKEFDREAEAA